MSTIIQIIPAQPGWVAAFIDEDLPGGAGLEAIVCWALIEVEGGARRVIGLLDFAGEVDEPVEGSGLIGYFPAESAAREAVARHLHLLDHQRARQAQT